MDTATLFIIIAIVAAVGGSLVALRKIRKRTDEAQPTAAPKEARHNSDDIVGDVRAMMQLREELAIQNLDPGLRGEIDELFARMIRIGLESVTSPDENGHTIRSLRELLQGTARNGWNNTTIRTTRVALEELGMMVQRGELQPPAGIADEWNQWSMRLSSMPDLQAAGMVTESALLALSPGDWLLVRGQLHQVGPAGITHYSETYEGRTWNWHEVPLVRYSDQKVFGVDFDMDDGLELSLSVGELPIGQLGLNPQQVRGMIEEEHGTLKLEGRSYHSTEGGTAVMTRPNQREEFDYLEFSGPGGSSLTLEDWGDEVSAFLSEPLAMRDLTLLRAVGR